MQLRTHKTTLSAHTNASSHFGRRRTMTMGTMMTTMMITGRIVPFGVAARKSQANQQFNRNYRPRNSLSVHSQNSHRLDSVAPETLYTEQNIQNIHKSYTHRLYTTTTMSLLLLLRCLSHYWLGGVVCMSKHTRIFMWVCFFRVCVSVYAKLTVVYSVWQDYPISNVRFCGGVSVGSAMLLVLLFVRIDADAVSGVFDGKGFAGHSPGKKQARTGRGQKTLAAYSECDELDNDDDDSGVCVCVRVCECECVSVIVYEWEMHSAMFCGAVAVLPKSVKSRLNERAP